MGGIFNPYVGVKEIGLAAKVTDAQSVMASAYLNLYKTKGDNSLFRIDFAGEVGLMYSPVEKYPYNEAISSALGALNTAFYVPFDQKDPARIQDAVVRIKNLLDSEIDADAIALAHCNSILKYTNPGSADFDIKSGGQADREIQLLTNKLYSDGRFSGGMNILTGMYGDGVNTYMSFDNLGSSVVPFGNIRIPMYFEQSKVFGDDNLKLKVNADIFLPPAAYISLAKLFSPSLTQKGSVSNYVLEGADMYTQNWMPVVAYTANLSKTLSIAAGYALEAGAKAVGDLGSLSFSELSLYGDFRTDKLIPGAVSAFKLSTGLEGTGLGSMDFTTRGQLGIGTQTEILGLETQINAQLFSMFRQGASHGGKGSVWLANYGLSIGLNVSLDSDKRETQIPTSQFSRSLDMKMHKIVVPTDSQDVLETTPAKSQESKEPLPDKPKRNRNYKPTLEFEESEDDSKKK